MNLDIHGLPVQADGDANDQLQRVGMILTASYLKGMEALDAKSMEGVCLKALYSTLQPSPGVYVRCVGNNANNVSADQLISVLAYWISVKRKHQAWDMFKQMCKRFGFAQNTRDGLNGDNSKWKLPDFMALRALPLFARGHVLLYPITLGCDLLLLLAALSAVGPVWRDGNILPSRRSPDDVDDNNTVLTLAVCRKRMATPLSILACKIFGKFRPWNLGCAESYTVSYAMFQSGYPEITNPHKHHPVYGALRWYHRAESGGNPEIAEMWRPICKEIFEP